MSDADRNEVDVDELVELAKERGVTVGGAFERHGQTVLQLLIAGLLAWFGLQVVDQGKSMARLEVIVTSLTEQMVNIQAAFLQRTDDRYKQSDADRDQQIIHSRIQGLESRLTRLETMTHEHLGAENGSSRKR